MGTKSKYSKNEIVVFKNGFIWSNKEKWYYAQEELDRVKLLLILVQNSL